MRDATKHLRPWLESWGDWRRTQLNIGYATDSLSCNPDLHLALPIKEPNFKLPAYVHNKNLTLEENNRRHQAKIKTAEKALREFHHVKRTETKPKRHGIIPDYNPAWRMNAIDRLVAELKEPLKQIIFMRYVQELKVKEIAQLIGRTEDTIHKRIAAAHHALIMLPALMVSHGTPIKDQRNAKNCNNDRRAF